MSAPAPIQFPDFNDWLIRYRALVAKLADKCGIEVDDARQEAWLAWDDAGRTWSPAGGASPATWVIRTLEIRLTRLAAQGRHGLALDTDEAPELAAEEQEIESWRMAELDPATEAKLDTLRAGTAGLADCLKVTQRRARQIVQRMVDQAETIGAPAQLGLGF